ncbi:MAG TPA: VWA domain-containing protein [Thermoanaerobaculia bacterium]|nr:VWA domain-containing protein [Thermoanaerobaculia bacterium]
MKRLLLLLAIAVAVSAQRRPPGADPRIDAPRIERPRAPNAIPRLGETIEVSVVNLDVVVTDREGRRVHGLTKDDFEIREAGKPQPITNFAEYRGEPAELDPERTSVEGPSAAPAPTQRPPRTIVLLVEHQALLPFRRDDLFAALHKLIDQTMESGDRAMVVTWRITSMRVRQAMTRDRAAIHAALDDVAKEIGPLKFDPAKMTQQEIIDRKIANELMPERTTPLDPSIPARPCAGRQLMEIEGKSKAVAGLMNSMGGVEGRKVLLMAMRRFGSIAGADCFEGGVVPPDQQTLYRTDDARARVIAAANANGFTVYPVYPGTVEFERGNVESKLPDEMPTPFDVDPKGMGSNSVLLNESQSLIEIADKTGGATAWGPDIVKLLPQIAEDLESYYSLGYRGRGAALDRTRKVVVTTKRKDLRVRMRSEIVEKSDVTRMKERVTAALSYVADTGTLGVRVLTGKVKKKSRNRFTLPLKVQVPIGQLVTVREGDAERGAFSLFIGAGNGEILFSDVTQRTQLLNIPLRDFERAKQANFTYEVDLTIDPKVDRVAVGVYDEVGRQYGLLRIDNLAEPRGMD